MHIKREYWLIIILLAFILIVISFSSFFITNIQQADVKKFVQDDLTSKYPGSDTAILTIIEKKDDAGQKYFQIKARVTKFPNTPCPERLDVYYYYPKQNFVTPPNDVITKNCVICSDPTKQCAITTPEEAIIGSHTLKGTEEISTFISNKISPLPSVRETPNSWFVDWDSANSAYYYEVEIARNGNIISIQKKDKAL